MTAFTSSGDAIWAVQRPRHVPSPNEQHPARLLSWFVLVFFYDILIYSSTWADHLRHLRAILLVLRQHRLFVKRSKCAFGVDSISYLSHIISAAGVAMDPTKVQAVMD